MHRRARNVRCGVRERRHVTEQDRRVTYMPAPESSPEDADISQAQAAAEADVELQRILRQPGVANAVREIAADPSALENYREQPEIIKALEMLSAHLTA
mmetsp:Transcript_11341/g.18995  ORF Transcript_11341/g.18995 Transcript_11341/m.18995 type:complete len:99 (+) Transcript_11341:440-736(+)